MSNYLDVYTIIEKEGKKASWVRVGVAFTNKDGSLTVRLDALPVNGQLHIREHQDREQAQFSGGRRPQRQTYQQRQEQAEGNEFGGAEDFNPPDDPLI